MSEEMLYNSIAQQREINSLPRWSLDMQQELNKFKLSLLGLIPNENFGLIIVSDEGKEYNDMREYVALAGANMVNERGATAIYNKLASELTKIPSDSNFTDQIIGTELVAFEYDFPFWLAINHENFGLGDENYDTICDSSVRLVKGAWRRSIDGWKGDLINSNIQQREIIQNNNTESIKQSPKIMGFMGK